MNRFWLTALLGLALLAGCKGKQGPAGVTGATGPTGSGIQDFTITFREGLSPYSGWTGTSFQWVDAANPDTAPSAGEIRLKAGAALANFSRGLVRFNLMGAIPSNATITGALLQLTTESSTSLGTGSYSIGIHKIISGCPWTSSATWDSYNGTDLWVNCAGNIGDPAIKRGSNYSDSPMDTATVKASTVNGNQVVLGWNLTNSVVQGWVADNTTNQGVVLCFETEESQPTGFISFYDNTGTALQTPELIVNYYIP